MLGKIIGYLISFALTIVVLITLSLHYIYKPVTTGTLYLKNAVGEAEIIRETETGFVHVYADSLYMALYSQGFLHARDRLWQMEKLRKVTTGRLAEIFGERAVQADKFSRVIGFYRSAKEAYDNMNAEEKNLLQQYSNGVNDFINGIKMSTDSTAKLLPPEFYVIGHTTLEEWTPVDSLSLIKLLNFHLSWNWTQDLTRHVISSYHKDLEEMIGEIAPFTAEFSHNLVTILNDEDIIGTDFWSDETLTDRYNRAMGKPSTKPNVSTQKVESTSTKQTKQDAVKEEQKKQPTDQPKQEKTKVEEPPKTPEKPKDQKQPETPKQVEKKDEKSTQEKKQESTKQDQTKAKETDKTKTDTTTKQEQPKDTQKVQPPPKKEPTSKEKLKDAQEPPKATKEIPEGEINPHAYLEDQMASNNWVIHGNHTKTGKPLLANDPHLGTQIPSHWYLMSLNYNGDYFVGTTQPGVPYVLIGRTNHFAWGVTAVLSDVSDLYKEQLSEDQNQYLVDGKWIDFKIIKEEIRVKGRETPYIYTIKLSHRGPVLDNDVILGAQVLFSGGLPHLHSTNHYSLAWGGYIEREETIQMFSQFPKFKTIHELLAKFDSVAVYASIPQNFICAFDNGDIGYILLATSPNRRNKTPYAGCNVFDGTNTDNDWDGYVKFKDLPRVINPKKGFIVTANNRPVPDNMKNDIGSTLTSTTRAQRITELISHGIARGQKFDYKDMIEIQQDQVDILARDFINSIVKISYSMLGQLSAQQRKDAEKLIPFLEQWRGEMSEDSIAATIYSTWQLHFFQTLFHNLVNDTQSILTIYNNYPFIDYYQRLILTITDDPENINFNKVCKGAFSEYTGKSSCAYNFARALAETKVYLETNVSPRIEDWQWRNVHVNEYANTPWSMTKLKPIFHREVPTGGNGNTINVSKYNFNKVLDLKTFKSTHAANYKQVFQFGKRPEDDKGFFSQETGQNGNIFAGHYFDLNRRHLDGDLYPVNIGKPSLDQLATETLVIKQEAARPKTIKHEKHEAHEHKEHTHQHEHQERKERSAKEEKGEF